MNDLVDLVFLCRDTPVTQEWSVGHVAFDGAASEDTTGSGDDEVAGSNAEAGDGKSGHWVLIHKGEESPAMAAAAAGLGVIGVKLTRGMQRQQRRLDTVQRKMEAALSIMDAGRKYLHKCRVWTAARNRASMRIQVRVDVRVCMCACVQCGA